MNKETTITAATPHVYQAIAAVQGELASVGIGKTRTNSAPGANYKFRGIDDVYNALSPLLAKHRLCILPRMISREVVERTSSKGTSLFYVTVEAEFDFVAAEDGSKHTVRTFGEAFDTGDKATNKAMSAAYKYAAFQTFAIPTEGDNDADASTHEVAPARPRMATDEQRALMMTLIPAAGKSVQEIVEAFNVSALDELTEAKAASAIKRLQELAKEPA